MESPYRNDVIIGRFLVTAQESKIMKTKLGLILLIIGVALIITSQTVDFSKTVTHTFAGTKVSGYTIVPEQTMKQKVPNEELINGLLYSGIGLLVIGGISFALGLKGSDKKEIPAD